MEQKRQTLDEYIAFLASKGFHFREDVLGFIQFGKQYTGAEDRLAVMALEMTLKVQKQFDGSFYISLLEQLKQQNITTRKQAMAFMKEKGLL
ncbi:hypothetical protein B0I26_101467 [Anoxybacillus vitaminiphilus]|uniref:Uncharacterized protein n=1 Tax=Paranoxybacillus vitaminiphilus TaxID=581036 RepID=A0A327YT24_9BACL|nr:DUF6123 family protein [Anoxybacillus vitaminiphilus]RAK23506.1 hypothetical protein B0I26_101467 [Anoxybacillus vitaminiphilus]